MERLRNLLLFIDNPKLGIDKNIQFFNKTFSSYDPSQQEAIRKALTIEDLLLIQGPPGTGKTTIIAEIIALLVEKNITKPVKKKSTAKSLLDKKIHSHDIPTVEFGKKPVLITAYTNKAVDTVVGKLLKRDSKLRIVRIGNVASISDSEVLDSNSRKNLCFRSDF